MTVKRERGREREGESERERERGDYPILKKNKISFESKIVLR